MNKKLKTAAMSAAVITAVFSFMYTANASSDSAGSSGDPLVTKSYVDSAMANVLNAVNSTGTGSLSAASDSFEPVRVEKGGIIIGNAGAEIILRSGTAIAYTESADGIIDVTTGLEYHNGEVLDANHMLIVSRDDGRGATVSSEEAWFIVKGGYTVK